MWTAEFLRKPWEAARAAAAANGAGEGGTQVRKSPSGCALVPKLKHFKNHSDLFLCQFALKDRRTQCVESKVVNTEIQ